MVAFDDLADAHVEESDLSYERYNRGKDVVDFDCGDAGLNEFLQNREQVAAYQEDNLGRTTLVYFRGALVGYFTLSTGALEIRYVEERKLPKRVNRRQKEIIESIPALTIGRFAVDKRAHGKGIGRAMMRYIVGLALALAEEAVAVRLVILQALPGAQEFYRRCGFEFTEPVKREKNRINRTMYLDLEALEDIV